MRPTTRVKSNRAVMHVEPMHIVAVMAVGAGATAILDLWTVLLKRVLGVPSPNYCLVGRWFRYMPDGVFRHESIAASPQKRLECAVGWTAHYVIGVIFAAALVLVVSAEWLLKPSLAPALLCGVATVAVPFLVMHPAFGLGVAASKAPDPRQARLRSLLAHTVFGIGLYVSALLFSFLTGTRA